MVKIRDFSENSRRLGRYVQLRLTRPKTNENIIVPHAFYVRCTAKSEQVAVMNSAQAEIKWVGPPSSLGGCVR